MKKVLQRILWVGRGTATMMGLAVILALMFGAASMAFAKNGDPWILGQSNAATAITKLAGAAGVNGPMLQLINNNPDANDTALDLRVQTGEAPMRVNSAKKVANLNADKLDGTDSAGFQRANAAAGGHLTGNYPNPQIAAGAVGATELATLPAVRATGGNPSIPSFAIPRLLQLPNEEFDQVGSGQSGEMHSTTANSRLVAPRDGIYQVDAQVGWAANATGVRVALLEKNGSSLCEFNRIAFDRLNANADGAAYNHLSSLVALNQGDYVEVCVYQTSGANLSTSGSLTFATMHYVSRK